MQQNDHVKLDLQTRTDSNKKLKILVDRRLFLITTFNTRGVTLSRGLLHGIVKNKVKGRDPPTAVLVRRSLVKGSNDHNLLFHKVNKFLSAIYSGPIHYKSLIGVMVDGNLFSLEVGRVQHGTC